MGKGRRNKHHRNKPPPSAPAISNAVEHVILEPRLLACLTVLGLGAGFGVGLMLAKVLSYTGYALASICAALAIWISRWTIGHSKQHPNFPAWSDSNSSLHGI